MPTRTLALVGCGAEKADEKRPAKDLYTSTYFRKKWGVAEQHDEHRILSAEYGLVHPNIEIPPYQASLDPSSEWFIGYEAADAWAGAVVMELGPLVAKLDIDEIVLLAGRHYADPVEERLPEDVLDVQVRRPFEGLGGLPGQMRWMSERLEG